MQKITNELISLEEHVNFVIQLKYLEDCDKNSSIDVKIFEVGGYINTLASDEEGKITPFLVSDKEKNQICVFQDNDDQYSADLAKASPCATGYIKWDGCSNWDFDCMHFCGPEDLKSFAWAMEQSYELCRKYLKNADY